MTITHRENDRIRSTKSCRTTQPKYQCRSRSHNAINDEEKGENSRDWGTWCEIAVAHRTPQTGKSWAEPSLP